VVHRRISQYAASSTAVFNGVLRRIVERIRVRCHDARTMWCCRHSSQKSEPSLDPTNGRLQDASLLQRLRTARLFLELGAVIYATWWVSAQPFGGKGKWLFFLFAVMALAMAAGFSALQQAKPPAATPKTPAERDAFIARMKNRPLGFWACLRCYVIYPTDPGKCPQCESSVELLEVESEESRKIALSALDEKPSSAS
jgi:hypothetical protein